MKTLIKSLISQKKKGQKSRIQVNILIISHLYDNQPANLKTKIKCDLYDPSVSVEQSEGWGLNLFSYLFISSKSRPSEQRTEVRFASFLSGGFINALVVNPPERKKAKRTSVQRSAQKRTQFVTKQDK